MSIKGSGDHFLLEEKIIPPIANVIEAYCDHALQKKTKEKNNTSSYSNRPCQTTMF